MKAFDSLFLSPLRLIALLSLLAPTNPLGAQAPTPDAHLPAPPPPGYGGTGPDGLPIAAGAPGAVVPQIDFKNTTVGEIVRVLRTKSGANIVVGEGLAELPVAELQLRNVSPLGILNALAAATGNRFNPIPNTSGGSEAEVITLYSAVAPRKDPKAEVITQVFVVPPQAAETEADFDGLVENLKDASKLTSQVTEEAGGGGKLSGRLKIEVHRPTRLVILAGPRREVELTAQVLTALGATSKPAPEKTTPGLTSESAPPPAGKIKATILGRVNSPGVYTLDADATLAVLIATAGGCTRTANQKKVSVTAKDGTVTLVDLRANPISYIVRPGDVVIVAESLY